MAVYDLEEQEQIAEFKAWWAQYGNWVMTLLLALTLGFAGWQGWNKYRSSGAAEASALYFELQQAVAADNAEQAREFAGKLISSHGHTVQAQLGALLSAGMQFRKNDLDNASPQLEWAADKGKEAALRNLARLRLATVLMQKNDLDAALARLQPVPEGVLRARFEDLRGDILASQGKPADARAAWQAAIGTLSNAGNEAALRDIIRVKLESLEG